MGTPSCDVLLKNLDKPQFDIQKELRFSNIPLTHPYRDSKGRVLGLWKSLQHGFYGTVTNIDGKTTFISSNKIINPLNPNCSFKDLQRISIIGQRQWDLAYLETQGTITIWPRIVAAAKDDPVPFKIRFSEDPAQFMQRTH